MGLGPGLRGNHVTTTTAMAPPAAVCVGPGHVTAPRPAVEGMTAEARPFRWPTAPGTSVGFVVQSQKVE